MLHHYSQGDSIMQRLYKQVQVQSIITNFQGRQTSRSKIQRKEHKVKARNNKEQHEKDPFHPRTVPETARAIAEKHIKTWKKVPGIMLHSHGGNKVVS